MVTKHGFPEPRAETRAVSHVDGMWEWAGMLPSVAGRTYNILIVSISIAPMYSLFLNYLFCSWVSGCAAQCKRCLFRIARKGV